MLPALKAEDRLGEYGAAPPRGDGVASWAMAAAAATFTAIRTLSRFVETISEHICEEIEADRDRGLRSAARPSSAPACTCPSGS
jgi:hypothetical protein